MPNPPDGNFSPTLVLAKGITGTITPKQWADQLNAAIAKATGYPTWGLVVPAPDGSGDMWVNIYLSGSYK